MCEDGDSVLFTFEDTFVSSAPQNNAWHIVGTLNNYVVKDWVQQSYTLALTSLKIL